MTRLCGASLVRRVQVTTHTSDIKGAGTDANVCCELFGVKATSGPRELTGKGNLFEQVRACVHACARGTRGILGDRYI